jgi:hypothetical protein
MERKMTSNKTLTLRSLRAAHGATARSLSDASMLDDKVAIAQLKVALAAIDAAIDSVLAAAATEATCAQA